MRKVKKNYQTPLGISKTRNVDLCKFYTNSIFTITADDKLRLDADDSFTRGIPNTQCINNFID